MPADSNVSPAALTRGVVAIFRALDIEADAAGRVAEALVQADCEGISSHGVMLVPMYADRIKAGSVSRRTAGDVVVDQGTTLVIDARNALGQLTAEQAVGLVAERAAAHGMAAVAVRNGFHFGTAGRWAMMLAERGLIGIVLSNTRPLMPAPGGAERLVGNNPLAIAVPGPVGAAPLVLDMALSASAMGKIRLAESASREIPPGWATDADGRPTTDPAAAIRGMLLPAAGPKGFGLAVMVDLICGGLSAGAIGEAVRPLYGDPADPYRCAHFFLGLDVARFRPLLDFIGDAGAFADRIRGSKPAPGTDRVFTPGEPAWVTGQARAQACPVAADTLAKLSALGRDLGLGPDDLASFQENP